MYKKREIYTRQRPANPLVHNNDFRVGGVAADLPYGWVEKCRDFCNTFAPNIDEYEHLITNNPIFRRRVEGVGILSREDAINWGISGPMLRASGVQQDPRKVDHYDKDIVLYRYRCIRCI